MKKKYYAKHNKKKKKIGVAGLQQDPELKTAPLSAPLTNLLSQT